MALPGGMVLSCILNWATPCKKQALADSIICLVATRRGEDHREGSQHKAGTDISYQADAMASLDPCPQLVDFCPSVFPPDGGRSAYREG
jgi:hypothetical protein